MDESADSSDDPLHAQEGHRFQSKQRARLTDAEEALPGLQAADYRMLSHRVR